MNEPMHHLDAPSDAAAQHQALQVLTLAQRTAEEHLVGARREADRICAEAGARAEQIIRDAQAHAQVVQQEAEKSLAEAHAAAGQMARDVQAHADHAQRNAEKILADARARAEEMAKDAQANADELKHQARQRYEEMVGSLANKREALQQQIEALERFDRDYRARLTAFMQNQLRALWIDEPRVSAEDLEQPEPELELEAVPAHAAAHADESDDE